MAFFAANIINLLQIKALTPINHRNPKLKSKSSPSVRFLQPRDRISVTIIPAATKLASDLDVQESFKVNDMWKEFSGNVSGEWDGHGADFTSEGKAIELPENVVPDAYREWEVRVFDWQTQCPTLAEPEKCALAYRLIKLLPTVGCEADAATRHTIDERNVGGLDSKVSGFAFHSSGCYVALWPISYNGELRSLEVEHCLVDPENRESRVRIVQSVHINKGVVSLQNVKVFREQWYGPFRNGDQLGGCAIRDAAFATTDALKSTEVAGVWKGSKSIASFRSPQTDTFQELVDDKTEKNIVRDAKSLLLLPKQLWCSLTETEDGETCGEVGWLLHGGRMITSTCILSKQGKLQEVAVGQETVVS